MTTICSSYCQYILSNNRYKLAAMILDALAKSPLELSQLIIPGKTKIQLFQLVLDSGFCRGESLEDFLREHHPFFTLLKERQ